MRISSLAAVILAGVLLVAAGCGQKAESTLDRVERTKVLRIGTDATYPPFETVNTATGRPEGFDIDLVEAICARQGWRAEIIVTPFDGIVPGLTGEKYDLIISAFTITPERAGAVLFSDPYYDAGQSIAVPLEETTIKTLADLTGKKVGVQLGTTGERLASSLPGVEVISFENIGSAFIDMENGRLDAVLNDLPTSTKLIGTRGRAMIVAQGLSDEKYGMAVRPADTTLIEAVNQALQEFKESGLIEQLQAKWF
ncbi:MAG: basic amino acid ABC transporter substrate-binding protein [candidate division Zixibacteria bacterium]|nr:basic amino acid ABC transporter substrate-binding protein [candidate division Zixibacteria bacterium]